MYRKAFLLLLICMPVLLFAQEFDDPDDDPSGDSEWDYYDQDIYVSGDQTFIMSLGSVFPTVFLNNGKVIKHNISPPIGGTGSLVYNYYFNRHIFMGGEFGGLFMPTLAENTVFIVLLGLRAGYQFNIRRFEFPLTLTVGMNWHRYLNDGYYGFFLKGGAAAYFRFNSEWSFGLNAGWIWLPELTNSPSKNVDGNVIDITLSARYHF